MAIVLHGMKNGVDQLLETAAAVDRLLDNHPIESDVLTSARDRVARIRDELTALRSEVDAIERKKS